MPNPKDTKEELICGVCGVKWPCPCRTIITDQFPDEEKHYPGCHKVHLECANMFITEAMELIKDRVELGQDPLFNDPCEGEREFLERWRL